jgi:heme-degrading monooxygenase HmoA
MINILAEVWIEDLSKFLDMFSTKGLEMRKMHGSVSSRVYKIENEAERIFILFEWESKESFLGFLNDQTVKETMKSSGTTRPPVFTFVEKAAEFDG